MTSTAFWNQVEALLGSQWVNRSEETIRRYGETTLPGPNHPPSGVVYPGSTQEVQAIVRAAIEHKAVLWPVSKGNNISLGSRAPFEPGQVVVDLGRRMNRIISFNEEIGSIALQPGISFQELHDELERRGGKFMADTTSGPPEGSVLGNMTDKGAGYTPYADHFGMTCGFEVVLGTGEVLRTGDGALPQASEWHMSKYSFGPYLDGLFTQANFGIVTEIGLWLMPKPPVTRSFFFSFPDDEDIGEIVELARPLKMSNFVPTMMRVSNDLWLAASEQPHPEYATSRTTLSDKARRALQAEHGIGAWVVSGAFYGASEAAVAPMIERVRSHFTKSGKARYIPHEEAVERPMLKTAYDAYCGVPTVHELKQLQWRPGGGISVFTPGIPMSGPLTKKCTALSRSILEKHGLEYVKMYVCAPRFARGLHQILFNRQDPDEDARADAAYRELATAYAELGLQSGRAPIRYHDLHMSLLDPILRKTYGAVKQALDPHGVLADGRYGIRSAG
jgi:4-cresol dehydrogenase (hydroxylating)